MNRSIYLLCLFLTSATALNAMENEAQQSTAPADTAALSEKYGSLSPMAAQMLKKKQKSFAPDPDKGHDIPSPLSSPAASPKTERLMPQSDSAQQK